MGSATEREYRARVRARVNEARRAWRLHRKMCRTCAQLSKDRSQYCDAGWAMRVELHYAEAASRDLRRAEQQGQQALF